MKENRMAKAANQFAVVTGAQTGIGFDLARECAEHGYDLLIAADEPEINEAAARLQQYGKEVDAVQTDLTAKASVEKLYAAAAGRPINALLDADWDAASSTRIRMSGSGCE